MYDVVTFGEAMVRLSSPEYRRLENATRLDVEVGGGEYNVAVGCARLGLNVAWVSRLVDNWTGWAIRNRGREHGVDMSHIVWVPFDGVGAGTERVLPPGGGRRPPGQRGDLRPGTFCDFEDRTGDGGLEGGV